MLAAARRDFAGMASARDVRTPDDWPNRPVTIVVPYGPGASNDTFTRALATVLTKQFGQPFVVSTGPAPAASSARSAVAKAAPDGYTLLEMPSSIAGFKPIMKVDLDPLKDLAPIGLMARSPDAMVVNAGLPVKTVKEFIEYARARPDEVFYGMAGIGTSGHQHAEMFNAATGLKLKGVNYKSAADAMTDIIGGRVHVMFVTTASSRGAVEAGQLRLLAYADSNFPPESLKAPTLAEAGVPNMEKAQTWWAIFGPPGLAGRHPAQDERGDQRRAEGPGLRGPDREVGCDAGGAVDRRGGRGRARGGREGREAAEDWTSSRPCNGRRAFAR